MSAIPSQVREDRVVYRAMRIIESRLRQPCQQFDRRETTVQFFTLRLAHLEREVFDVIFLDNCHQLIAVERMFSGTINEATIHPREVVRQAMKHNASALIVAHNHPSGNPKPSAADKAITRTLRSALDLVDVHLLDHVLVAGAKTAYVYA